MWRGRVETGKIPYVAWYIGRGMISGPHRWQITWENPEVSFFK